MEIDPRTVLSNFLDHYPPKELPEVNPLVLIPSFENQSYLLNTITQLEEHGLDRYFVIDGGSRGIEMLDLLARLSQESRAVTLPLNPGPRWFAEDAGFFSLLPKIFCVTDPDLQFNPSLPEGFLRTFLALTMEFQVGKVGFALELADGLDQGRFWLGRGYLSIREWEEKFWQEPLVSSLGVEAFSADIDTTFALYNKDFFDPLGGGFFTAVRVAGDFSARHIPWYPELDRKFSRSSIAGPHSNWSRDNENSRVSRLLEVRDAELKAMRSSLSWRATKPLRSIADFWRHLS